MLYRVLNRSCRLDATASGRLAGSLALLISATSSVPASAQDCSAAGTSTTTCSLDARRARLGEMLTSDPTAGRLDPRLDGKPWIAQDWNAAPLAVTPGDENVALRASTTHWNAHNDWSTARRIEELKAAGNPVAKAYKPQRNDPALDVWSTLDVKSNDSTADRATGGGVGADYKLDRKTVLGAAVTMREKAPAGVPAAQEDYTVSTYVATRPSPNVTLDASVRWGETTNDLAGHAFASTQGAVTARMRGNWSFSDIRFTPSVSVARGVETSASGTAGEDALGHSTFAVEPRVSKPIPLGNGETLEPFLAYKRQLDIEQKSATSAGAAASSTRSAGAGVTLARPDAYSLSVTGGVEGLGATEPPNLKGQLQLKIPLR